MQISVFEILNSPNAMFHQDGLKLHRAIIEALEKEDGVEVSFAQVKVLTTQFLNASFGKIMVEKGMSFFAKKVKVSNTDHLATYETKLEWVVDNIKNNDNYRTMLDAVLA
ncbi:STAS-like domain-containing protein [Pedobacter sp. P26]|uniref:STAS-like domain-containing protein n=1 Tax=Pedobacter sp. P26 TaxID=3423956 RepID=UPI003D6772A1